jgi:hypothetical protein
VSEPILTWTAHPARRRPRDIALVIAVVSITTATVLSAFQSGVLALLSAALLLLAVSPFLLPTRYLVTEDEVVAVRAFTRRRRRFADLHRLEVGPGAALVSPFRRRHVLDRYRGLVLFLDGTDRERVIATLRARIHPA